MPTAETKSYFEYNDPTIATGVPVGTQISLEETFLVSAAHKKLLESTPLYWEVLSFFAVHESEQFTLAEVMERLAIPKKQLLKILGELVEYHLLRYQRQRYRHPKIYMHIPNDKEFFKIRHQNFMHTTKQVLYGMTADQISRDQAFRTTINKQLSQAQVEQVLRNIKFVMSELLNLPNNEASVEQTPYSFCIALGKRDFSRHFRK